MDLLSAGSLAWLGLLVPLVLLYILKRRRERRLVPSTLLWEAALRDMRAERPWQRLKPHLSLLLQALALILGALALARPAGAGQAPTGATVAVVIDASASMGARDSAQGPTRLERAVAAARSRARSLPPGGAMLLIRASAEPAVLTPRTSDRAELEAALDRLAPGGPGVDLEAAVALAAERLRGAREGSRVVVLTDAAVGTGRANPPITLAASVPVEVQSIGGDTPNHAIVAVDVRSRAEPDAPDRAEIFARVARFGEGEGEVRVTASSTGGALLGSRRVSLRDGRPEGVVLSADLPPDRAARGAFVRVELDPLEEPDGLATDNVAYAASPAARRLPVFLVGDAPGSLTRVFGTDGDVELFATDLDALARRPASDPPLEGLFVYVGRTPRTAPPGFSVVVAPSGPTVFGVPLGEPVGPARIVSWDESDPRMRFVRFGDVNLSAVRPLEGPSVRALLTVDAGPVIGAISRPDAEITIVSFDPRDGDWTARPSFVVFFRNLLERARAWRAAGGIAPGTLGAPVRVPAPEGERVQLTTPAGAILGAASRGGVAVIPVPAEPGVFEARLASGRRLSALRNLLDGDESDLRARARFLDAEDRGVVATVEPEEHREAWPWLAGALLLVLAAEILWTTRSTGPA